MDIESYENILAEARKNNKKKAGNRPHKYTCVCGFYTGRRYNYERHQSTCKHAKPKGAVKNHG